MNGVNFKSEDIIEITDSDTSDSFENEEDEDKYIVFCRNLTENVTEEILYELFLQCGPVENVTIPKDSNGNPRAYAFIKFVHKCSVPYCLKLLNGTKLFGQPVHLNIRQRKISSTRLLPGANNLNTAANLSTNYSQINVFDVIARKTAQAAATAATAASIAATAAATTARVIPKTQFQPPNLVYNQRVLGQNYFGQFPNFVNNINNLYLMYLPPNT